MSRRLLAAVIASLALAAPASAQEMSANVERVATLPEMKAAISLAFIENMMYVSTAEGVFAYDVSDPASPQAMGALPMYIWENEDMDVDVKRKRIFISRDPRGFTSPAAPGALFPVGAVHVIDVSNPHVLQQVGFFTVPAGHTTTCVNDCDFIWTAGPYANEQTQPDWVGRPVFATDVTDPANPVACPEPIDLGRNDGVTDYAHDVQVDSRGIAWVSGAGGVRGYWTRGVHRDPVTQQMEEATGCKPIPYAGSGTPESATASRFMHNAQRDPGPETAATRAAPATSTKKKAKRKRCKRRRHESRRHHKRRCAKLRRKPIPPKPVPLPAPVPQPAPSAPAAQSHTLRERTLFGTEENIVTDCATSGRFVAYDLEGTFGGEGFKDTASTKHRMKVLDTWWPEKQEGSTGCDSAHYFALRGDGISANSFYSQGVRFLDVSDPRDLRQVGWYRPSDANVWAPYWHKGAVFVADFTRGIDVLKFSGSARSRTVRAPERSAIRAPQLRFSREAYGGLCPLTTPRDAA